jgi:hypothetical protein
MPHDQHCSSATPQHPCRSPLLWTVLLIVGSCFALGMAGNSSAQSGAKVEKGDVEKLVSSSGQAERLVNQKVKLHDVKVLTVTPQYNFWAGFGGDDSVFVVQGQDKRLPLLHRTVKVQHGDTVSITGVVQPAPQSPEQLHGFGIKNPDEVQRISREKVYVQANQVKRK